MVHDTPSGGCGKGGRWQGGGGGTTVVSTTRNLMRFQTRHRGEKAEEFAGRGALSGSLTLSTGGVYVQGDASSAPTEVARGRRDLGRQDRRNRQPFAFPPLHPGVVGGQLFARYNEAPESTAPRKQ